MPHSLPQNLFGPTSLRAYVGLFLASLLVEFTFGRTLQRLYSPFLSVGRIAAILGTLLEFLIIISLIYVIVRSHPPFIAMVIPPLLLAQLVLGGYALGAPFVGGTLPLEFSLLFQSAVLATVSLIILHRIASSPRKQGERLFFAFLTVMLLSFVLSYYYRFSTIVTSNYLAQPPFYMESWWLAQMMLILGPFALMAYSLEVPCKGFRLTPSILLKTLLIPSMLLVPIITGMLLIPRMRQYVAMYLAEILGLTFSRTEAVFYIVSLWFYLAAVLILWQKGRIQRDEAHLQDSLALSILFFGGLIFQFTYYSLIPVIGAMLLSHPFSRPTTRRQEVRLSSASITERGRK